MIRQDRNGLVYYTFENLDLSHAIFTRLGGASQGPFARLNVGHTVGDEVEAVEANHGFIYEALGLPKGAVVTASLVHSGSVAIVGAEDRGKVIQATDGLVTGTPGVALMLRFADCLPILLYDPQKRVIALGHAGWRGTIRHLARNLARAMKEEFDCQGAEIKAGLGPAIGPCCYRVGPEVAESVKAALSGCSGAISEKGDGLYFDLWEATRWQLKEEGIENIEVSGLCTACHTEEFFSHRAEGGRTGRFAALMTL